MSDHESDFVELEPDFGEVMALLREGPIEPPGEAPGEEVWNAIAMEVGGDIGAEASRRMAEDAAVQRYESSVGSLVPLDAHRSRGKRFAIITAVAAAILLIAVPVALASRSDSADRRARLVALAGFDGAGTAELSDRTLTVEFDGPQSADGSFYELWLLQMEGEELQDLRSLGRVAADGSVTIPDDVDLGRFSVVDVSVEPDDGNPEHSGDSVLRGDLEQA